MLKDRYKSQRAEPLPPQAGGEVEGFADVFGPGSPRIIRFTADDGRMHGLPASQLIHFVLEKNTDVEDDASAPPDRLTLLFSMHNVVLTGWRLNELLKSLEKARLAAVTPGNIRYVNLRQNESFVASLRVDQASHSQR